MASFDKTGEGATGDVGLPDFKGSMRLDEGFVGSGVGLSVFFNLYLDSLEKKGH